MTDVKVNPILAAGPTGQLREALPAPVEGSIITAGIERENDMFNLAMATVRPVYQPDPEFKILDALDASSFGSAYSNQLARAQSQGEFDQIEQTIAREQRTNEIFAAHPVTGFIAAAISGAISPLSLIPFVGPAKGIKGATEAFLLAGAAMSAQESILFGLQETRTPTEAMFNIGAGTVLGGLLGTAGRQMHPKQFSRAASDMADQRGITAISVTNPATGEKTALHIQTIQRQVLPEFDPSVAKVGDEITVYRAGDEPTAATITYRSAEDVIVQTEDGKNIKLDEGEVTSVPRDPEASDPIQRNVAVPNEELLSRETIDPDSFDRKPFAVVKGTFDAEGKLTSSAYRVGKFPDGRQVRITKESGTYVLIPLDDMGKIRPVDDSLLGARNTNIATLKELREAYETGKLDAQVDELHRAADTAEGIVVSPRNLEAGNDSISASSLKRNDPGRLYRRGVVSGSVIDFLAAWNPLTRLKNSIFASARKLGDLAGSSGTRSLGAAKGITAAGSGFLQARVQVHIASTAQKLQVELDELYYSYLNAGAKIPGQIRLQFLNELHSTIFSPPAGKMKPMAFREAVTDAYATGIPHVEETINQGVERVGKYIDYFRAQIEDAQNYREELTGEKEIFVNLDAALGEGLSKFFHQVYDSVAISKNRGEFTSDMLPLFVQRKQTQFRDAVGEFNDARMAAENYVQLLSLTPDQLRARYTAIEADIRKLSADQELVSGNATLAVMRKQLRDAGETEKAVARANRETKKNLGEGYLRAVKKLNAAKGEKRLLDRLGAQLSDQQAKLLDTIDDLEEAQIARFDTEGRAAIALDKKLTSLTDEVLDTEADKLWERFTNAIRLSAATQHRLHSQSLLSDVAKHDVEVDKALALEDRTVALFKKIESIETLDREAAREVLRDAGSLRQAKAADLNARKAVRAEHLREKIKTLDVEERTRWRQEELVKVSRDMDESLAAFETHWRERGGEDVSALKGVANFNSSALDEVNHLYHNLVGSHARIGALDLLGDIRGAEKTRSLLFIPYEVKKKWLIRDASHIMQVYARHIAPDLELWRATGKVNAESFLEELTAEDNLLAERLAAATHTLRGEPVTLSGISATDISKLKLITPAMREKLALKQKRQFVRATDDMKVIIERLRFQHGRPLDPEGFFYRLGRTVLDANVTQFMGGAAVANIADIGATVVHLGLSKMIKGGTRRMMMDAKAIKMTREEAASAYLGINTILVGNRAEGLFGTAIGTELRKSVPERVVHELAKRMSILNLLAPLTDQMEMIAVTAAYADISRAVKAVSEGAGNTDFLWAQQLLARNGLGEDMARRIWHQYGLEGGSSEVRPGLRLPNGDKWQDLDAVTSVRALAKTLVDNAIFNSGIDRPTWTTGNILGKLLGQFQSYNFMAINRMLIHGLQEQDMAFMSGTMISLALGSLAYYTVAMATGGRMQERMENATPQQWLYEAMSRSFLFSASGQLQQLGAAIPALNDYWLFGGGEGRNTRAASTALRAVGGPTYTTTTRILEALQGLDSPTASTAHTLRQLFPYNQLVWARRIFDSMEDIVVDTLDLPERRN